MMYIENIFICISIPLLLSLIFIQKHVNIHYLFVLEWEYVCFLHMSAVFL